MKVLPIQVTQYNTMGATTQLWTTAGLVLWAVWCGGGVEGAGDGWYCDFAKTDIPLYRDVLREAIERYRSNPNTKFYPITSVYREMVDTMNCEQPPPNRSGSQGASQGTSTSRRVATWPQGRVPFVIDPLFSRDINKRIRDDMRAFTDDTCVSFVERDKEDTYVTFVHPNNTRIIEALMVYEGPQQNNQAGTPTAGYTRGAISSFVRTEADILTRSSGVMQTLMFILGVPREENRFDRDDYIKLTFFEADKRLRRIFQKNLMTQLDLDFPYDTLSSAHMTMKDAEDLRVGLESLDPEAHPIKEHVDSVLSQGDIKKLNYLYCGGSIDGSSGSGDGSGDGPSGTSNNRNQTQTGGSSSSSSTGRNGTSSSSGQTSGGGGGSGGFGGGSDGSGGDGSGGRSGRDGDDYSEGENQGNDDSLKEGMTGRSNGASSQLFLSGHLFATASLTSMVGLVGDFIAFW